MRMFSLFCWLILYFFFIEAISRKGFVLLSYCLRLLKGVYCLFIELLVSLRLFVIRKDKIKCLPLGVCNIKKNIDIPKFRIVYKKKEVNETINDTTIFFRFLFMIKYFCLDWNKRESSVQSAGQVHLRREKERGCHGGLKHELFLSPSFN